MTGNYFFEGLRSKRPMVHACLAFLLIAATASATPRQAPEEPRLERLEQEAETTTESDAGYILGRIVGGKPVSVLRKREHGGAATNRTSSGAARPSMRGNSAGSSLPASGVQKPWSVTTVRPYSEDGLRPDSSNWNPSLSGSSADAANSRPNPPSRNLPSHSGGGSFVGRPTPPSYRPSSNVPNGPHKSNGFDDDHRVGLPDRNTNNGNAVPWNHQGVSPGYSVYPTPVTAAHTDDEPPGYNPNPSGTPNVQRLNTAQNAPPSSNTNKSPGRLGSGIIIGHPPPNVFPQPGNGPHNPPSEPRQSNAPRLGGGINIGHPPPNVFPQPGSRPHNPPSEPRQSNAPRLGGGIIIGSPPTNALGGQQEGFQNSMPSPELEQDQARRGVVNYPPQPSQGGGSFGLPSIPNNPFAPANPGFHGQGSLPLPFGAGLFNPGLVNIQKAVENAAAGVLGATGGGPNPAGTNVFGRTSSFGQMSSYGFRDRK